MAGFIRTILGFVFFISSIWSALQYFGIIETPSYLGGSGSYSFNTSTIWEIIINISILLFSFVIGVLLMYWGVSADIQEEEKRQAWENFKLETESSAQKTRITRFKGLREDLLTYQQISESGINEIDKMSGFQFEEYLKCLLKKMGYEIELTQKSFDFGADLIATKNSTKVAIQAKNRDVVGIQGVQEVAAARSHYKTDRAMVIASGRFTQSAIELAKTNDVILIDRHRLINLINDNKNKFDNPNAKVDINEEEGEDELEETEIEELIALDII